MSELKLRLADVTVRAKITSDAQHVVSVYDVMDLACPDQCESWRRQKWKDLIAEKSEFLFSNGQKEISGQKQIHYNHYNFMPPACTPNNQ